MKERQFLPFGLSASADAQRKPPRAKPFIQSKLIICGEEKVSTPKRETAALFNRFLT